MHFNFDALNQEVGFWALLVPYNILMQKSLSHIILAELLQSKSEFCHLKLGLVADIRKLRNLRKRLSIE